MSQILLELNNASAFLRISQAIWVAASGFSLKSFLPSGPGAI